MTMQPVPTLQETIELCLGNAEFMREYRRLTGHRLGGGPIIDQEIDKATGKLNDEARQFIEFVRDHIWWPVAADSLRKWREARA